MKYFLTVFLITFNLFQNLMALKSQKWERVLGKKYEPPYLAEYNSEVTLCLDLCLQLQDCAGVTGKNCFQSNRGNESYWCAIAGAQSQTTTGDYTYVSYEQSLWNGKSYDDYNAITVNYNQTLEGPYKIGPERAIHCPDGNPSESYHPYYGYNYASNLHNKDDNYWRLSDEQKDIGFIWDYGCEFTLHSVAMKQLKIDSCGTKEFEIYVDKNYHGTDDSKYNLFASGTMPQCDDANTCTDTLHVIKAPSRITRYLYFKVTATYEDVGGLTYFVVNPNPKDDSDLCQTQF